MNSQFGKLTKLFTFFENGRNQDLLTNGTDYFYLDSMMPVIKIDTDHAKHIAWFQLNRLGHFGAKENGRLIMSEASQQFKVKNALTFGI